MRYIGLLFLCLFLPFNMHATSSKSWAVYYENHLPLEAFAPFELLVFDSYEHPSLRPLTDRGKTVLGYLSLGELEDNRYYFKRVKKEGIVLHENPYWEGGYYIDIRETFWTKWVIERLIPDILRQGFHGIFLDTVDNPPHLERQDPQKFKGMTEAAVDLVKAIRLHYPHIIIMMNRGYELLPEVAPYIDKVLGESVYADYDFEKKTYGLVETPLYERQVKQLKQAKKQNPLLEVYTLDYWDRDDALGIAAIYKEQRANGFIPYVSTIDLEDIIYEPKVE